MAAHAARPEWIADAVRSIQEQFPVPGWQVELRIGADGCPSTSAILSELGLSHWRSAENVGSHVMRNSLVALAPADVYATFDCDDIMESHFLKTLLPLAGDDGIGGPARVHVDEHGKRLSGTKPYRCGVAVYSAAALARLGGFRDWRVAADYDAIARARAIHIPIRTSIARLYRRRIHPTSLTQHPATGMESPLRAAHKRETVERIAAGEFSIMPVTTPLERVETDSMRQPAPTSSLAFMSPGATRRVEGTITVRATRRGFYDNHIKEPGDVFTIRPEDTKEGKLPSWMEAVEVDQTTDVADRGESDAPAKKPASKSDKKAKPAADATKAENDVL